MKIIIIDDEIKNRLNLQNILEEQFPEISILGSFSDVDSASEFITNHEIDLAFLDINMPEKNGFDLLSLFPERNFQVIFVTAYDEYAIRALKSGATDYILKPLLFQEIHDAIKKAEKIYFENNPVQNQDKIVLTNSEGKIIVNHNEIIFIQGINNACKVFMTNNRNFILSKTLKHFEEFLNNQFFRVHKSYLINKDFIYRLIVNPECFVELKNNVKIPVSRRNLKHLKDYLDD